MNYCRPLLVFVTSVQFIFTHLTKKNSICKILHIVTIKFIVCLQYQRICPDLIFEFIETRTKLVAHACGIHPFLY